MNEQERTIGADQVQLHVSENSLSSQKSHSGDSSTGGKTQLLTREARSLVTICILVMGALCLFAALLAVIVFPIVYLINVIRFNVYSNPLNMHHPAFVFLNMLDVSSRWTIKNAFLSYRVFLYIPVLMLIGSAIITFRPGIRDKFSPYILGLWLLPIAMLALTVGLLAFVATIVRGDLNTIRSVNALIQSKMTASSSFNILSNPNVDRLTQITKYQSLMKAIETDSPTEYAKALFTINMYLVMYEMGSKHENIDEALKPFQGYSRLRTTNFMRFLSPESSFIPNRINEIMINAPNVNVAFDVQQQAINEANKWITELNMKLSSVTYTSVSLAFLIVSIGLILIYLIPLKLIMIAYRKKN